MEELCHTDLDNVKFKQGYIQGMYDFLNHDFDEGDFA